MEDQIWNCIIKRVTGTETLESRLLLDEWLSANESNLEHYEEVLALWHLTGKVATSPTNSTQVVSDFNTEETKNRSFKRFFNYGIAASLALLASFGAYYLLDEKESVAPNYVIRKAELGKMLAIQLPDSSKIWLNAGSELKYIKKFDGKTRTVELSGEAFFDVKHDENRPFVVLSENLKTVVYGTSFNVRAYVGNNENAVTVKTGKVGVLIKGDSLNKPTMLLPGNHLAYYPVQDKLKQDNVLVNDIAVWINGDLTFDQAAPKDVFATIARKFNVKFSFDQSNFDGCKITAKFPNQSLKSILTALSASLNIKVNEQGETIEIKGGQSCK